MKQRKIRKLWRYIISYPYQWHLKKYIVNKEKGKLIYHPGNYLELDKNAKIILKGKLQLQCNNNGNNARTSILRIDRNGKLIINGDFSFMYDADIIIFENGILELGNNSFINSSCKIRCHYYIKIGDGCAVSHDFTIMDSDAHLINGNRNTEEVIIGNHVWIGTRVTILSGVHVGDGSVIAAGAVLTRNVPENCLVGGVPAKILKRDISWEG